MKLKYFLLLFLFITSCSNNSEFEQREVPKDLLSKETMKEILAESILLESAIQIKYPLSIEYKKRLKKAKESLFKKYGTDAKRFNISFEYYHSDKEKMNEIYSEILDEYSIKKSKKKN
jgi:hypothetical protein